jgi:chromosome segregation ATPase
METEILERKSEIKGDKIKFKVVSESIGDISELESTLKSKNASLAKLKYQLHEINSNLDKLPEKPEEEFDEKKLKQQLEWIQTRENEKKLKEDLKNIEKYISRLEEDVHSLNQVIDEYKSQRAKESKESPKNS